MASAKHYKTLSNSLLTSYFYGEKGFDDLKQSISCSINGSRDIANVLADRAALDQQYAKGLNKLGDKLTKVCASHIGGTMQAWAVVAEEMKLESQVHEKRAGNLLVEVVSPLKSFCDAYNKAKKPIESAVERTYEVLTEKRNREQKAKLKAFQATAEAEKLKAQIAEKRAKKLAEGELAKMDKKLNVLKEAVMKSAGKYYTYWIESERGRQEWESTVLKSICQLQQLEEDRLGHLRGLLTTYKDLLQPTANQISMACERIQHAKTSVNCHDDVVAIGENRKGGPVIPEQTLFEIYAEDFSQPMEVETRRQALTHFLTYLSRDLETEKKALGGLTRLLTTYKTNPASTDFETTEQTKRQLIQTQAMINSLSATHFKLAGTFNRLTDNTANIQYEYSSCLKSIRDRNGLNSTVLMLSPKQVMEDAMAGMQAVAKPEQSKTGLKRRLSDLSWSDFEEDYSTVSPPECSGKVLFDFERRNSTELTAKQGDTVKILERDGVDWFTVELNGRVGFIPQSYVEIGNQKSVVPTVGC